MDEAESYLLEEVGRLGWMCLHRGESCWVVFAHGGRAGVVEIGPEGGRPTEIQKGLMGRLEALGVPAAFVTCFEHVQAFLWRLAPIPDLTDPDIVTSI